MVTIEELASKSLFKCLCPDSAIGKNCNLHHKPTGKCVRSNGPRSICENRHQSNDIPTKKPNWK